jgi:NCS1 family nucleobase:cation symporter-1
MPAIVSSIAVTVGVIALLIWALVKQGGGGPLLYETSVTLGKARLQGSALAWAMTRSVTTTIGGWAGAILYQSGAPSSPSSDARD